VTRRAVHGLLLAALALGAGCELLRRDLPLPSQQQAASFYREQRAVQRVELSGNVVEVYVVQDPAQLRRGGSLWAKVAPYVYVFSPATRALLEEYAGIAAVRVITETGQEEIARVLLHRDALNDILWRRSLNILGHALQEGTRRPTRLEELVVWGERHTEYRYNPEFVPEARARDEP
jgi:hypothetical protein